MMATAKSGKKTIGIRANVCILVISAFFLVSLIQSQEAYAEKKRVSGTSKLVATLADSYITLLKTDVKVISRLLVLNSTDTFFNNATYFFVNVLKDTTAKDVEFSTYAVITHPGGDQTFIESVGSWKTDESVKGFTWSSESNGRFIRGSGKFKGIKAIWKFKEKGRGTTEMIGEWEVEYTGN